MTTFEQSLRRSRAIAKAAAATLHADPRLFVFPVVAIGSHAAFATLWLALLASWQHLAATPAEQFGFPVTALNLREVTIEVTPISGLLAYVGFQIITIASAVALTQASMQAFAGRPWSFKDAFRHVLDRRASIAGYAVIRATAGTILRSRRKGGRNDVLASLRSLGRMAWWSMTYLTIPVITRENRGPIRSIERSATLFAEHWREGVVGRWTLAWLWLPHVALCAAPLVAGGLLGVDEDAMWLALVLASASLFGLGGVVLTTFDTLYRTALYVFAAEGVVPEPFDVPDLDTLWYPRDTDESTED